MTTNPNEVVFYGQSHTIGLTKREYMAALICSSYGANNEQNGGIAERAVRAVTQTDALIEALNGNKEFRVR